MKRHRLLRRITLLGFLIAAATALLHPSAFATMVNIATGVYSTLTAIYLWARGITAFVSTAQFVEGAAVAWFVFVLALVLLARSRPPASPAHDPPAADAQAAPRGHRAPPATSAYAPPAPPYQAPSSSWPPAAPYPRVPPLPARSLPRDEPLDYLELTGEGLYGSLSVPAGVPEPPMAPRAASVSAERRADPARVAAPTADALPRGGPARGPRRTRGHVLALGGVSRSDERLLPYGLFIVAEDAGSPPSAPGGSASQHAVEVIAEQLAPSLASAEALGSAQLAALLKLAVIHAGIDLRHLGIRTATNLEASVTGVLVIGHVVHVVNVGDCRAYVFRPRAGLMQITTDHSVISCLVEAGLLQPEALYQHPRRDQIYRSVGGSQPASEVDAFELSVHRDDLLLLCSPELWHALRQPQIEAILRAEADPQRAAETLARAGANNSANATAGDFSVIVVRPLGECMPAFGIPGARAGLP